MRHLASIVAIGAIAIVATACSVTSASPGAPGAGGGQGGTLDGTHWKLTSFDANGTMTTVPAGVTVDARFATGGIAGSGGCNAYTGPVTVTGASIKIGALVSTQMACAGAAGDVERVYFANLASAASFTATTDALTMFNGLGAPVLVYAAGPANPLEGSWNVTGYNNGKQAVTSPIAGTTLTAVFTADTVSGSAGCNDYNGSYKLDGDKVTIGPLATTRKACEQPVMDQENAFLTALQTPASVEQSGGIVTLRDAAGATQVTLGSK